MRTKANEKMGRKARIGGVLALTIVAVSSAALAGDMASARRGRFVELAANDARGAAVSIDAGALDRSAARRRIVEVQATPSLEGVSASTMRPRWIVPLPIPVFGAQLFYDGSARRRVLLEILGAD